MKVLKKLVLFVTVVAMLTAAAGCGAGNTSTAQKEGGADSGQKADDKQLEFMFCAPKTDDPIWLVAKAGFDAAAEDFGFKGVWTGCTDHSVEGTVQALESTIASQPDGIVACPIAPPAFTSTLKKAKDSNIPVISVILKPESKDLRTTWIGADFTKAGLKAMTEIHKALGTDEINFAAVVSNMDVDIQIEQYTAGKEYVDKLGKGKMVEIVEDHADPTESYRLIKDLLTAHPEINAIQSTESGGTPGVGKALNELNLSDKVVAVCSDDTDINLDTLRKGYIHGVTAQDFWGMGYLAGQYLFMKAHGMEVPDEKDTGVILVTNENIDTYAKDRDAEHEKWRQESKAIKEAAAK